MTPGAWSKTRDLGHRGGVATGGAAADGGGDLDPDEVTEGAGEGVGVAPGGRAGHGGLPSRSVAPEPLLAPGVAVVVVAEALPKPGSSVSSSWIPATHLALFHSYRWGPAAGPGHH